MLDYTCECDYKVLMESVRKLADKYDFLNFSYLTESVMGRGIPLLRVGEGKKNYYYVGTHHGAERITGMILLRFIYELCEVIRRGGKIGDVDERFFLKQRSLFFIPQLNVDGADISANGPDKSSPWYSRLVGINGSDDFSRWQANARGIDLNHNYDAGFEEYKEIEKELGITTFASTRYSGERPESEPETNALCAYFRFFSPRAVITLHTQGREIYYTSGGRCPLGAEFTAKRISCLTGYKLSKPSGAAAYGGLTDYCIQKLGIPSFTVECGKGENPLPPTDIYEMYAELRRTLLLFPTMC
ncbi:MAG: gamma-D-glutamyl-meso-diaminopimelate peptidase [Clostridia bacterium]|nr:gamma-D-glutamyl-meso-diaminopimelate peptidase [Clostridia bacterium]